MSKDRQHAREARQEARRREVAATAARRERLARRRVARARLTPSLPRRRRRYGALSTFDLLRLLLAFLVVQAIAFVLVPDFRLRLVVAVLTLASLAVLVRTRRRPTR